MRTACLAFALPVLLWGGGAAASQPDEPPPVVSPGTGVAPPVVAPAPPHDATREALALRLRLLEQNLLTLDARSNSGRLVNGIASLVIGGVLVTLGATLSEEVITDDGRGIFFVFGGLAIADGLLTLLFIPSLGDAALDFQAMPQSPRRAALGKMRFGERTLRNFADQSRTDRLINGIGGTVLGLAGLGALIAIFEITPKKEPIFFYILVAFGAIQIITGVITIVTPSRAERMWNAYERAARRNPVRRRRTSLRPGVAPLVGPDGSLVGATGTLGIRF